MLVGEFAKLTHCQYIDSAFENVLAASGDTHSRAQMPVSMF